MIKNHPFQNGNKRIAVMSLLYFLFKNKKWLRLSERTLYEFAVNVAKSNPKEKDQELKKIEEVIKFYLVSSKEMELSEK